MKFTSTEEMLRHNMDEIVPEYLRLQKLQFLVEMRIIRLESQFRYSEKHMDYRIVQQLKQLLEESKT